MTTSISYTTGAFHVNRFSASDSRKKKDGPSGFPSEPPFSADSAASHRERPQMPSGPFLDWPAENLGFQQHLFECLLRHCRFFLVFVKTRPRP